MGAQALSRAAIVVTSQFERRRRLITDHPELRRLMGHAPTSAWCGAGLVLGQTTLAIWLGDAPWWQILFGAYAIGAVFSLGLLALVHESTHNLVFQSARANIWFGIAANLPNVFPAASSFRKYHIAHHRAHGDPDWDGDMPGTMEARLVGNCAVRKALWLFFYFAVQIARVRRLQGIAFVDRWLLANVAIEAVYLAGIGLAAGTNGLAFLLLSSMFGIGLHPLGARWIQEHYPFREGQESYSYYGPLNHVVFNAGYHAEHHDLAAIPWMKLPQVRKIAPEYYDSLYAHRSWTGLLIRFLFDKRITLRPRAGL